MSRLTGAATRGLRRGLLALLLGAPLLSPGAGRLVRPLSAPALAAQEPLTAMDRAAARYREVEAICADFDQVIEVRLLRDTVESAGRICQRRPNLFSMRFTDPEGDMVVSDGEYVWVYYPSRNEKQVIRRPAMGSPGGEDFFHEFLDAPERNTRPRRVESRPWTAGNAGW